MRSLYGAPVAVVETEFREDDSAEPVCRGEVTSLLGKLILAEVMVMLRAHVRV